MEWIDDAVETETDTTTKSTGLELANMGGLCTGTWNESGLHLSFSYSGQQQVYHIMRKILPINS